MKRNYICYFYFLIFCFSSIHAQQKLDLHLLGVIQKYKSKIGNHYEDTSQWKIVDQQKSNQNDLIIVHLQQYYQDIAVCNKYISLVIDHDDVVSESGEMELGKNFIDNKISDNSLWMKKISERYQIDFRKDTFAQFKSDGSFYFVHWSKEPVYVRQQWFLSSDNYYVKSIFITWFPENGKGWLLSVFETSTGKLLQEQWLVDDEQDPSIQHKLPADLINIDTSFYSKDIQLSSPDAVMLSYPIPMESPSSGSIKSNSLDLNNNLIKDWFYDGFVIHDSTRGNNVWVQEDRDRNNNTMGRTGISTSPYPQLNFSNQPDFTQPPTNYNNQQAGMVNLFQTINRVHDIMVLYGFDEGAGNFQQYQHAGYGLGNDLVIADAQDPGGVNNANFSTPPDGLPPRMQLYLFNRTSPMRDACMDNTLIIHEYMHGISNRLTGGPTTTTCLRNTEQPSEGWSDYLALMLTTDWDKTQLSDSVFPRVVGEYVTGNSVKGMRNYPYTTDMAVNPLTYESLPQTNGSVHKMGEIWCSVLWDMTWALMAMEGINPQLENITAGGGNVIALQLVVTGMKLQTCLPGFLDARDAILKADTILYRGIHSCIIWKAFAKRGMGMYAVQGSSNDYRDQVVDFHDAMIVISSPWRMPNRVEAGGLITVSRWMMNTSCSSIDGYIIKDILPLNVRWINGGVYDSVERGVSKTMHLGPGQTDSFSYVIQVNSDAYHPSDTLWTDTVNTVSLSTKWQTEGLMTPNWQNKSSDNEYSSARFYCPNLSVVSDEKLISKNSVFIPPGRTTLQFSSRMQSEYKWDGGVVEASIDNGMTWFDLGDNIVQKKYNEKLNLSDNPLAGRLAFTGVEAAYENISVDLSDYAQEEILWRFRFGSDATFGNLGWNIDNMRLINEAIVQIKTSVFEGNLNLLSSVSEITIDSPSTCRSPQIMQQPVSTRGCFRSKVSFTLSASGDSLHFQWQKSKEGQIFENIWGANDSTLLLGINTMEWQGTSFRCLIWGACGHTIITDTIHLQVDSLPTLPQNEFHFARCGVGIIRFNLPVLNSIYCTWQWLDSIHPQPVLNNQNEEILTKKISSYINDNQTFKLVIYNYNTGCSSKDTAKVIAHIYQLPEPPLVMNTERCGPGSVLLTASHREGEWINWYSSATDTQAISRQSDTMRLLNIVTSGAYYAESQNPGCRSLARTPALVTIKPLPENISRATSAARCGAGMVNLSAVSSFGSVACWFSDSSCSQRLYTSPNQGLSHYTIPSLDSTKILYVVNQRIDNHCLSSICRVVNATVHAIPSPPQIEQSSRCGPGRVLIKARVSSSSETVRWYGLPRESKAIGIGLNFNTPSLAHDTFYYGETVNRLNQCSSNNRISIPVTIYSIPPPPVIKADSICSSGMARLMSIPFISMKTDWYADAGKRTLLLADADTFITSSLTGSKNYYALRRNPESGCTSPVTKTTAFVKRALPAPGFLTYPKAICSLLGRDTNVLFKCGNISGTSVYQWKIEPDSITFLSPGNWVNLNLKGLSSTNYISVCGWNGCPGNSKRVPVCSIANRFAAKENSFERVKENGSLRIYPNPFLNSFSIKWGNVNFDIKKIQVIDSKGQIVFVGIFKGGGESEITGATWPAGIYFIKVWDNQNQEVIRVIKSL